MPDGTANTNRTYPQAPPPPGQKPPVVTGAGSSTPPKPVDTTEVFEVDDSPIVAKPLTNPDFTGVKLKNPNLAARWINRLAAGGIRYQQMESAGFVPVVPSDCVPKTLAGTLVKDGHIIYGDLILCKIAKKDYEGALKYNVEMANARIRKVAQKQAAKENLDRGISEDGVSAPSSLKQKITFYQPDEKEMDQVQGKSGDKS